MRLFLLILLFFAAAGSCAAQEDALPLSTDTAMPVAGGYLLGEHLPERQQATAFRMYPNEATARTYYYGLLGKGYDLEATRFMQRNRAYAFALTPYRRGFESIYAEAGARLSGNRNAGAIYNGSYGGFFRVSGTVRIWHSVSYLQQDDNLGGYRQGEYFSALYAYLGHGWYLKPALHYIYASFTDRQHDSYPVSYTDTQSNGHNRYTIYQTDANQAIDYTAKGHSHYLHLALPVARRIYDWTFEAQPSLQFIHTGASRSYSYVNTGTTDSLRNGRLLGSEAYNETGTGSLTDTVSDCWIGQIGGSISHSFYMGGVPVLLRAGGWYLLRQDGLSAAAYQVYALIQVHPDWWIHTSFLSKGRLPFALAEEGLYLNMYHLIQARAGLTVQAFPLKRWSPMITYQYERQQRYTDDATLIYHALYFTLKYRL